MLKSRTSSRQRPAKCCDVIERIARLPRRDVERYVLLFKALSDPTRLEIVRLVAAQSRPLCVCDLVSHFKLSQSTISHHLKALREAGILNMSRAGIWSICEVDPAALDLLEDTLESMRKLTEQTSRQPNAMA